MNKVVKDKKRVEEVITRGVEVIYPDKASLFKLLTSGKRIKLYCGFDPSAPSLHIGNAVLINKLSQFQELGHEVVFLIGDFTGMIGDPTDKAATRKKLSREDVLKNCETYQTQASAYLDFKGENKAEARYNSEWLDKITFKDLIEITSNFTVQQMIQRDMFQKRIEEEKPIHLHEFLYPIAQGYDSVFLNVDLEVGGNDQMFNMMTGRDLMKAMGIKEKFVITMKLLADPAGKKMGKSEGNAVFLDQEPKDVYGAIMSWPDGIIPPAFELCTKVPMPAVAEIKKELESGKTNPRDLKMKLAFEITKLVHGEKGAQAAEDYFVGTFQKKETPVEIAVKKVKEDKLNLTDLLALVGLVGSKNEARRVIEQGGVKVDGVVIKDPKAEIAITKDGKVIQKGKKDFVKVLK